MAIRVPSLCVLLVSVFLGLLASTTLADGKAFATSVLQPTMPDQRAMIVWDGSTETLLIDTAIEGADAATAWVVPVPNEPEVFEVDRGVFPTLQVVFQPRVLDGGGSSIQVGLLFIACTILLAAYARAREGWGCLAIALLLFSGCLGVLLLMPALGSARATARGSGMVPGMNERSPLIRREQVGLYDVAILHGSETHGIVAWLDTEGFVLDPASREAIAEYVAEDWWFVASKLDSVLPESAAAVGVGVHESRAAISPHPLGLRFAATEPVYPMRLTGTQGRDLRVDLFVFGSQMANAPGLEVRRCGRVRVLPQSEPPISNGYWRPSKAVWHPGEEVLIGQEQLRELVGSATTATRLAATLSPAEMDRDVALTMGAVRLRGNTVISRSHATKRAITVWAALLVMGSVVVFAVWGKETPARRVSRVALLVLVVVPIMLTGCVWLVDRGVATRRTISGRTVQMEHAELSSLLACALDDRMESDPDWAATAMPETAERLLREQLSEVIPETVADASGVWQNPLLGIPMREAAEPGGYRIWHDEVGVWYAYYDLAGQEIAVQIWSVELAKQVPDSG